MKYLIPKSEDDAQILPNLLNLSSKKEIDKAEFEGFYKAEIILTESLTSNTKFNALYICNIHKIALEHLYSFAGKYRKVNLSKGRFLFPSAKFVEQSMQEMESKILNKLSRNYKIKSKLLDDIAKVHAELLFIHPFRKGNGRVARLLANLMIYKSGYERIKFERIKGKLWNEYIIAVQSAGIKNYDRMAEVFKKIS